MHGFPERLRQARQAAGLTQYELAIAAGVQPMTISRWERGVQEPSHRSVVRVARVLGVSTDSLTAEAA